MTYLLNGIVNTKTNGTPKREHTHKFTKKNQNTIRHMFIIGMNEFQMHVGSLVDLYIIIMAMTLG